MNLSLQIVFSYCLFCSCGKCFNLAQNLPNYVSPKDTVVAKFFLVFIDTVYNAQFFVASPGFGFEQEKRLGASLPEDECLTLTFDQVSRTMGKMTHYKLIGRSCMPSV